MMGRLFALVLVPLALSAIGLGCGASFEEETEESTAFIRGEVIVRYHKDLAIERETELIERHGLRRIQRHRTVRIDHLAIDDGVDVMDKIDELQADPDVLYAEPNYLYRPSGLPDDWSARQWGLHNDGTYGTVDADIDAREAWNVSTGSDEVVVAVIDSGVDWDHPDLTANIWRNGGEIANNGVDDDHNGYVDDVIGWDFYGSDNDPDDEDGHGSHVAGIIGAAGDNGQGVVGVNWDVTLMPLRFIGPYGGSTSAAVGAIEYAVDQGAQVINASWGGPGNSSAIRDAIAYANDHGVLFVTASGNDAMNSDHNANYPNNYDLPNILTVAATTSKDQLASFSNYGSTTVDVGAPGQAIYSTYAGGGYEWLDGTSMACPMVTGAAALALSVDPDLSALALKQLLMATVDPLSALQGATVTGGRINVQSLLLELDDSGQQDPPDDGGEEPPADEDPPQTDGWSYVAYPVASPHPYANDFDGYATIEHPGAAEIKLHFDRFELEQGYDFVELEDGHGTKAQQYTGHLGAFETDPVGGDTVTLRLITDYSVTDYGIDLAGYSWR